MASTGFWKLAAADPERIALIDPDDEAHTAGELLAACNRIANGLRALGLHNGDTVAAVLPNGLEMVELYLAALQIGLYLTPINHHLVGPEIAYIVGDSGAKVFVTHGRFADEATAAVEGAGLPQAASFAVAGDDGVVRPGFRPYEELGAGQPDTPPPDRSAGTAMHYTSGTTGKPKGVKRGLYDIDPDDMATLVGGFLAMFGVLPHDGSVHLVGSPLYHTAVLMCMGCSLHIGHSVVLMDKWAPEQMLEKIDRYRVTTSHMVPTQFHRLLALPEDARAKYDVSTTRHMIHAAAPCPPDVKRRMIEWWGTPSRSTTRPPRAAARSSPPRSGSRSPAPSARRGRARRCASSTTRAPSCPCAASAPSTWRSAWPTSSTRTTRRRPTPTGATGSSPSATSATSTRTATCSSATARAT